MGLKEKKCILPLSIVSPIYCCCDHFSLRHIRLGDTVKPRLKGALYLLVRMRHLKVKVHSPNLKTRKLGVGRGWRGIYQVPWVVLSFSTAVTDTQWALSTKDAVVRLTAKENYLVKLLWKVCLEKSPVKSCSSSVVGLNCPSRCGPDLVVADGQVFFIWRWSSECPLVWLNIPSWTATHFIEFFLPLLLLFVNNLELWL